MGLPMLPADKANHALYGAAIFLAVGAVVAHTPYAPAARLAGVVAAFATGLLKEVLDARANRAAVARGEAPPHGVEGADVLATAGGALLCWAAAAATGV